MGVSNLGYVVKSPSPRAYLPQSSPIRDLESLHKLARTIEKTVVREGEGLEINSEKTLLERREHLDLFSKAYLRFTRANPRIARRMRYSKDESSNIPVLLIDGEPYDSSREYSF